MSLEGALEVSGLEFPDLDGAVFRGGGDLGVLRVEGECGNVGLMAFEFELGRGFREIHVFEIVVILGGFSGSLSEILLEVLDHLF